MYPFHALLLFAANAAAGITATAAITEADDTSSATATVLVQSAAAITEADDTLSATGTVLIQAAAAITEADDTLAATGTTGGAVAAAETFSGGWAVSKHETETDAERKARIYAERIKLGIIEPDPPEPAAVEAAGATIEGLPASTGGVPPPVPPPVPLHPGLAVDLAELYAGAWLDQEIKRHFELLDDEDTAVLLIAIATAALTN